MILTKKHLRENLNGSEKKPMGLNGKNIYQFPQNYQNKNGL